MIWNVHKWMASLVLLVALFLASCGPAATPTSAPATAEPTSQVEEPTAVPMEEPTSTPVPTEAPTLVPTEVPTETPVPEPSETPIPRETIYLVWAAGGVPPADSDDVDSIVQDITEHEGIVSGNGNEIGINVTYYPDLITVEEIIELFDGIGHPVSIPE